MALDAEKLRAHLKESGIFSDAEIDAEVLSAVKDSKAEERRTILNTQKVETPSVAQSSPAIAAAPAAVVPAAAVPPVASVAPVAKPITAATTPAELFDMRPKGTPVQRIGENINEAAAAAAPAAAAVASNATQDSLDYARNAIANNPELTGALAAIPFAYGANKLGLFDTLGSKMSSTAQAQPMVGGSGPRNTPQPDQMAGSYWDWANKQPGNQASGSPSAAQPQAWGIHDEPPLFAPTPAAEPTITAAPAAAPVNTKLQELQARAAAGTPATGEFVGPMQPVGPPEMVGPRKPIVPSAAPNSPATQAVTETIQQLGQAETPAMPSRPVTPTPAAALPTGELRTGSGLPVYAGEGKPRERFPKEFKTTADIPKGYAFVPGMGAGTNVIRNDFGQAGYNALVQEQGGPFGADKETREFIKQYNEQRVGPPATRELRKSLGLPMPENTKGIPMKIAKVGGVVGAIMAIPELANAAQNRDAGQAATVASGFLPPAIQALIYSGGLNAGAENEARFLRMRDYALKAGRGVDQGYDPRRLIGVAPPTR
jgi:hypothetical protein